MCVLLDDLFDRGFTAGGAYNELRNSTLDGATPAELEDFAVLLLRAPQEQCQVYATYAVRIAYWLGL